MSKLKFPLIYVLCILIVCVCFYILLNPKPLLLQLSPVSDHHEEYLEQYGWHIHKKTSEDNFMPYSSPGIEQLKSNGLDLTPYFHKSLTSTTYLLKEKEIHDDSLGNIFMTIYEYQGEIIGAIGYLEEWVPGNLNVNDKAWLEAENRLK